MLTHFGLFYRTGLHGKVSLIPTHCEKTNMLLQHVEITDFEQDFNGIH